MRSTASDITREHYARKEVRRIIYRHAYPNGNGSWKALNGDFHVWYHYNPDGTVRLLNANDDYDNITKDRRVLYQTLNVFEPELQKEQRENDDVTKENPLGALSNTIAYTLGVDIDKKEGCDIHNPAVQKALEEAAKFLVDRLKDNGIHDSVWLLFSGGGIYVEIHHEICRPNEGFPKEGRMEFFELLTDRYNSFIVDTQEMFYAAHSEHQDKVKFDALNNAKRIFKSILSFHRSLPYAVTPLNRDDIKIDLKRASVPLNDDMLAEARGWYSTFEPSERDALLKLLDEFVESEDEERAVHRNRGVYRSPSKFTLKDLDKPCIKYILHTPHTGVGKTRCSGILSAFLYEAGWDEDESWDVVRKVSERNGVDNARHIFESCFGKISCPSCATIQKDGAGYPHLGLKGLRICNPAEVCRGCKWPGGHRTKPEILVGADLARMFDETLAALQDYNDPPIIFQRGGALCRVQDTDEGFRIQDLTDIMLRNEVALAVEFVEEKKDDLKPVMPPMSVVKGILALRTWNMPKLKGLVSSPVLRPDGSLLLEPGYDVATGLYYHSDTPLVMPHIPDRPTKEDALAAANYLIEEVLWDFPFDGEPHVANASRAGAVAAFVSPIVRPMVAGKMPLCLIDKPSAGTGATMLMDLVSIVATGEEAAKLSTPNNDEEWRKQISSWLRDGSPLICLDNIDADLKAPSLSRALTTLVWRDRVLGKPDDAKYPQRVVWYANGNNMTLAGDLPRRSYLIQMDTKLEHPWERKTAEFHHPAIVNWVTEHRAEILSKIMIMARAWVVAGRPLGSHTKILGGFEPFTDTLGGILTYAGVGGFLVNMDTLYENLDVENEEWDSFFEAWYTTFGDKPKTATEIMNELNEEYSLMRNTVPTEMSDKIQHSGAAGNAVKVGKVLRKKLNVVTKNGFKLTYSMTDTSRKTHAWKLMKNSGQTEW
jgi:hypothetical protein